MFLKPVAEVREAKKPNPNIAGIVLSPKIAITSAPERGSAVLAAVIAKKYTNPHGSSPLSIPSTKKLRFDLELSTDLKAFLYNAEEEKECSIRVRNLIFPRSESPAKTITTPAKIKRVPFAVLLKVATPPSAPNIAPKTV
jgi:hypothetical protein